MQAGYVAAIQLKWAHGSTACALRLASESSFTNLGRMDSCFSCWLVVSNSGDWIRTLAGRPNKMLNTMP